MNEANSTVELLEKLGEKLGQTLGHLWPKAVHYVVIGSLCDILMGIFLMILGIWVWRRGLRYVDTSESNSKLDEMDRGMARVLSYLAFLILLGIGMGMLFSSIVSLVEPEGYLVHEALQGSVKQ